MSEVMIGKYTIESLTTGMYTDPYVIFREYIQNAADAIDVAVEKGVIPREAAYIKIIIDPVKKTISIEDNGIGLSEESAYQTLSDIGNSKKIQGANRGFRGIGRWRQSGSTMTPFWFEIKNLGWKQDESVMAYLHSLPEEKTEKSRSGSILIALETPIGLTLEETVQALCNQVLYHIDRYTEFKNKIV